MVRVRSEGSGEQFFINVATGGMGAEVSGAADGEMKKRWGKLAYLRASLEVAREYEAKEITLTLDGDERKLRAVSLAIGNCRYARRLARGPYRANPEDGLLDLVVIEDVGVLEVLKLAPTVLADSDYLDKERSLLARAKEIRVEASPGSLEFTVDGGHRGRARRLRGDPASLEGRSRPGTSRSLSRVGRGRKRWVPDIFGVANRTGTRDILAILLIGDFGVFATGRFMRLLAHPLGPHLDPERSGAQAQGEHTDCEARHHHDAFRKNSVPAPSGTTRGRRPMRKPTRFSE